MSYELPAINEDVFSKCQVSTPHDIGAYMLDLVGYRCDLVGKHALEYAFGEGAILLQMAERYIQDACAHAIEKGAIAVGLGQDITGVEIDVTKIPRVRAKLDVLAAGYGIHNVPWNLKCEDALMIDERLKYDFIIGNPPYLESKAMRASTRTFLRENFRSCTWGKFDYFYAFVEKTLLLLSNRGVMVHIVPSSIFKNRSAKSLRHMLQEGITDIVTFSTGNVFQNVTVSPCIFRYAKVVLSDWVTFSVWGEESSAQTNHRGILSDWAVQEKVTRQASKRFGDEFNAFMPVATLCNDAFLIDDEEDIEREIVRTAASPRQLKAHRSFQIIFPYIPNKEGISERIDHETFEVSYPKACAHLSKFRDRLDSRKADKRAEWFEYGRSQCLSRLGGDDMLLISTVVSESIVVYELDKTVVPYGGIVVTAKEGRKLDEAKSILQSSDFLQYARKVGTTVNGSSVRITCRIVNEYCYDPEGEKPS